VAYEVESQTVINAITSLLRSTFTTEELPAIYDDFVVQNMTLPCAVVKQQDLTDYRQMRPHHSLRYIMDIRFHPHKTNQHYERWGRDVAYKALQSLQKSLALFGQKIHFTSTEINVVDEVTHLLLVFSFFIIEHEDKEKEDMEKLNLTIKLKKEV